jgi:HEAT repeat protein
MCQSLRASVMIGILSSALAVAQTRDDSSPLVTLALERWNEGTASSRLRALQMLEGKGRWAKPAIPILKKALSDADPRIRGQAVLVVGEVANSADEIVPGLIELVDDEDPRVSKATLTALGRFGPSARAAIPSLLHSIHVDPSEHGPAAVQALAKIGEPAVAALGDLLRDKDPKIIALAARGLAALGTGAKAAIPALVGALGSDDDEVRNAVVGALASIGDECVQPLCQRLRDPDVRARREAAVALTALGEQATLAIPALIRALADPALRRAAPTARPTVSGWTHVDWPDESMPTEIHNALTAIGSSALPRLLLELDRPEIESRARAIRAIGFMRDTGWPAIHHLLALLDEPLLRIEAADALGRIPSVSRAAIPTLVHALNDPDPIFRVAATRALGRLSSNAGTINLDGPVVPPRKALAALRDATRDADSRVRRAAAIALRDAPSSDCAPGRTGAAKPGDGAAGLLVQPEPECAAPELLALSRDPSAEVRIAAVLALGQSDLAAVESRKRLVTFLNDPNRHVAAAALQSGLGLGATASRLRARRLNAVVAAPPERSPEDANEEKALVEALLDTLNDGDSAVRITGIQAVSQYVQFAARANPLQVRVARPGGFVVPALTDSPRAQESLKAALGDSNVMVRRMAASVLPSASAHPADLAPALVKQLDDPDLSVRLSVIAALRGIGRDAAVAVAPLLKTLELSQARKDPEQNLGGMIVNALTLIAPDTISQLSRTYVPKLNDPDPQIRETASKIINVLSADSFASDLFKALAEPSTGRESAREIIAILARHVGMVVEAPQVNAFLQVPAVPPAVPFIGRVADEDDDAETRRAALQLLVAIRRDRESRAELIMRAIRDGHVSVPKAAALASGSPAMLFELLRMGLTEPDPAVRLEIARSFVNILPRGGWRPDSRTFRFLLSSLDDPDPELRVEVVHILGNFAQLLSDDTRVNFFFEAVDGANAADDERSRARAEIVTALVPLLRDPSSSARWTAAWALGQFPSEQDRFIADLVALAKTDRERVPASAVERLPWFENSGEAPINSLSANPRGDAVRLAAIHVLGRCGKPSVIALADFLPSLLDDADLRLRHEAIAALAALGADAKFAVPKLVEALKSPEDVRHAQPMWRQPQFDERWGTRLRGTFTQFDPSLEASRTHERTIPLRLGAVLTLGRLGPVSKAAVSHLVAALDDPNTTVRVQVAIAIGAVEPEGRAAVPGLLKRLEVEADADVVRAMFDALTKMGDAAVPGLAGLLTNSRPATRVLAARALGGVGHNAAGAIPTLLVRTSDRDDSLRASSLTALGAVAGSTDAPLVAPKLLEALNDRETQIRSAAASGLGKLGTKSDQSIASLVAAFRDPEPLLNSAAMTALMNIGAPAAPAVSALLRGEDGDIRNRALQTLGALAFHGPLAAEESAEHVHERALDSRAVLVMSLGSADERIRAGASQLLQGLGTDVLSDLTVALRNPSPVARREIMKILTRLGSNAKGALGMLKEQADDPDPTVREAAAEAIKAVSAGAVN